LSTGVHERVGMTTLRNGPPRIKFVDFLWRI
jgi:hypothetical protein